MTANLTEEINALKSSSVAPLAQPDLIGFITEIEPKELPMGYNSELNDELSDLEFHGWDKCKGKEDKGKGKGKSKGYDNSDGKGKGKSK